MPGALAAGKTSLVSRFAHGLFSENHHTTVGVPVPQWIVRSCPWPNAQS